MPEVANIRVDLTLPDFKKFKQESGTLLAVEQYIREHIKDQKTRDMFDFAIEQYELSIDQLIIESYQNGFRCATKILNDVVDSMAQRLDSTKDGSV